MLKSARILRSVLENLLSLGLLWKTTSYSWCEKLKIMIIKLEIRGRIETFLTTELLISTWILRRVLGIRGDSDDSGKAPVKTYVKAKSKIIILVRRRLEKIDTLQQKQQKIINSFFNWSYFFFHAPDFSVLWFSSEINFKEGIVIPVELQSYSLDFVKYLDTELTTFSKYHVTER